MKWRLTAQNTLHLSVFAAIVMNGSLPKASWVVFGVPNAKPLGTGDWRMSIHSLPQLSGTPKEIAWATSVRLTLLGRAEGLVTDQEFAELAAITRAGWWIQVRRTEISPSALSELASSAWLMSTGITDLPGASAQKIEQAMRNGGRLEPLRYSFGSMGAHYTHLLVLKGGAKYLVSSRLAPEGGSSTSRGRAE
jgi:hypothetical protein